MQIVNKTKKYYKEMLFYTGLFIVTGMKVLDISIISKSVAVFAMILYAFIAIVYTRHIYKLKELTRQKNILILLPILWVITQDWCVLFAIFTMSFTVFKLYERTKFNVVLKAVYGVFLVISILAMGYLGVFINQWFQNSDEYEGYVCSPDVKHVITYRDEDVASETRLHTYYLEDVYLGMFKKEQFVIAKDIYRTKLSVRWLSNSEVEIGGVIYNIDDKVIKE